MKFHTSVPILACVCLLGSSSFVMAIPYGAPAGFSGGRYTGGPVGQNCAACHEFNLGPGQVRLLGMPQRYRADAVYDLTVRIADAEQVAGGFELSAESDTGHAGSLQLSDPVNTRFADDDPAFVTHTLAGYDDSILQWRSSGGAYEYSLRWVAPSTDVGRVVFFVAGVAASGGNGPGDDRFYATYATADFGEPGDADGDGDLDMADFAALQRCFHTAGLSETDECRFADFDGDGTPSLDDVAGFVDAVTGPVAPFPAGYVLSDAVRGGVLYDKWWTVIGAPAPTGLHPLYPPTGQQTGNVTFRCKECHGWDYKGRDGVYGSGSHATGIRGIFGTTLAAEQIFALLKADPAVTPNGHNMNAYGMTDSDLWDVTKMTLKGQIDTDDFITNSMFLGDPLAGHMVYENQCISCHGWDGRYLNFGSVQAPEYVGTVAVENPWEFLHKVRFGHPRSPMPSMELLDLYMEDIADLGAFAATLPTE